MGIVNDHTPINHNFILLLGIFTILIAAIMLVLDYLRPADMNKFVGTQSEIHSPYDDEVSLVEDLQFQLPKWMFPI